MNRKPVQLALWVDNPDDIQVQCEHCGAVFNAAPQLTRLSDETRQRLLAHPAVSSLPRSTQEFLLRAPVGFLSGYRTGVAQMAAEALLSVGGVQHQLRVLTARGLVAAEPKRPHSRHHQYRLILPNGSQKP